MELINRYIAEVGKHLPRNNRADIQKEIRSILEDMLDDRSRAAGHPADEAMVMDLLREFGKPEKVAASYMPERHLIGPFLYPTYLLVLKIVLPILTIVLLVTSGISLFSANLSTAEALKRVWETLLEVVGAIISALGSITLTFAILERIPGIKAEFKGEKAVEEKDWDPRSLPQVQDVEKFSIPGLLMEIVFTVAAMVVFNLFPQIVGIGYNSQDAWWVCIICSDTTTVWQSTILSSAFFRYLPFLNLLWGLEILLNIYLLRRGRWESWSHWVSIGLKVFSVVLAIVMLAGPSLINVTAASLIAAGFPAPSAAGIIVILLNQVVRIVLGLIIIFSGLDIIKELVRMFQNRPQPVTE